MRSTFSTIFYLKRQVVKKDGTVPIMGRITVDGTQTQFRCVGIEPYAGQNQGEDKHPLSGDYGQGQLRHGGKGEERLLGAGAPMPHLDESL